MCFPVTVFVFTLRSIRILVRPPPPPSNATDKGEAVPSHINVQVCPPPSNANDNTGEVLPPHANTIPPQNAPDATRLPFSFPYPSFLSIFL